ncbi:hypothetical protein Kpho02_31960 [Kitasatospora phosalacinea]|uniref:Transposase IS701-like DDE domain-containing protein n=1 Tax=Kitasatospora phosalacinea TaxID=2065 RepID=A0A9W6Q6L4_9ACTN|nr:hypothetical protein Kpho02_31960 [Kitasatospora phosalacinea]
MVVADAGYGASTPFRQGLQERSPSHVLALTGKEVAHARDAEPHRPDHGGPEPPALRPPPNRPAVAGPRPVDDGRCLLGILFVLRTGSPRRARRASPTGPQRSGRLSTVKAGLVSGAP